MMSARWLVAMMLTLTSVTHAETTQEAMRARLAQLTVTAPQVQGTRLLQPKAVVAFYRARGGEPAWNDPREAQSIRQAIADIEKDGLTPSDYHLAAIDQRMGGPGGDSGADLEILLSDAVAGLVDHVRYGRVRPSLLDPAWNVNSRQGAQPLEQVLARVATASDPAQAIEQAKLDHFIYRGLKGSLGKLRDIQKAGGWPSIPVVHGLKLGDNDSKLVPLVRKRLAATGELAAGASLDAPVFDAQLADAVKLYQQRNRLQAQGVVDRSTLRAMNVPIADRIGQVRANLERARWVLPGLRGDFLLVNLPAFKAYLIRGNKNVWEARTMIGNEARQTPSFRADMRTVVFNPDWTVPPTILQEDVLDGMKRGEDMIAKKHLTILDHGGRLVDPSAVDWASATAAHFPYTLRQPPGEDNALGRVKFVFPNSYGIYLHDTPSRDLFTFDRRTFSSGCIRIENPLDLARILLEGKPGWDAARIQQAVASGRTQPVSLPAPLPVLIVYWTVSVGAAGEVRFARDVYDQDPILVRALDGR